jgi:TolA-binding protein
MKINNGVYNRYEYESKRISERENQLRGNTVSVRINNELLNPQYDKGGIIRSLMEQKSRLQDRISRINSNDNADPDRIQSQIKEIIEQIEELDKLIAQVEMEKKKKELEKKNNANKDSADKHDNSQNSVSGGKEADLTISIVNASNALEQTRVAHSVKTNMEGEAGVLKSEIELDKARSKSGDKFVEKEEKLSNIESRISELNINISSRLKKINQDINDSRKAASEDGTSDKAEESKEAVDSKKTDDAAAPSENVITDSSASSNKSNKTEANYISKKIVRNSAFVQAKIGSNVDVVV